MSILADGEREKNNPTVDALVNPDPLSNVAGGNTMRCSTPDAGVASAALVTKQPSATHEQQQTKEEEEERVGGKHLDSVDAHLSPSATQCAYPARCPTPPSVVTWFLPTVVKVVATEEARGDGDIDNDIDRATAMDQGKRVRNLCKVVRGKLLRLLVTAGWA